MIFEEARVLQAELELQLAELRGLEARRRPEHVAEGHVVDRGQGRQHVPGHGHHRLDPADPGHRLVGGREAVLIHQRDRQIELMQHLLEPQLLRLVDDDEEHLVVQVRQRLLRGEKLVERQIIGIGHAGGRCGHAPRLSESAAL